jgi:hypothetical protein
MPAKAHFDVKYYRMYLATGTISTTINSNIPVLGYINCLDASANWSFSFTIYFLSDNTPHLPAPFYDPSIKSGGVFRPISQMSLYADLLHSEKSIEAFMDNTNPDMNGLETGPVPVGN